MEGVGKRQRKKALGFSAKLLLSRKENQPQSLHLGVCSQLVTIQLSVNNPVPLLWRGWQKKWCVRLKKLQNNCILFALLWKQTRGCLGSCFSSNKMQFRDCLCPGLLPTCCRWQGWTVPGAQAVTSRAGWQQCHCLGGTELVGAAFASGCLAIKRSLLNCRGSRGKLIKGLEDGV